MYSDESYNDDYRNTREEDRNTLRNKTLGAFGMSLLFASLGAYIGQYVPMGWIIPLSVFEIVILIVAMVVRRTQIGYPFLFFFTALTGVTVSPVLSHYVSTLGSTLVLGAFLTTALLFTGLGIYGYCTKRNLGFLGGILFSALLGLIMLSVLNFFVPLGGAATWVITLVGIIIFSGYVMYDFNRMAQADYSVADVPLMALNLYLDFLNLFLDLLRLFSLLTGESDGD